MIELVCLVGLAGGLVLLWYVGELLAELVTIGSLVASLVTYIL